MNGRLMLGGLAGLLLALPLMFLLKGLLQPKLPESLPHGKQLSPVLDTEESTRRSTYRRECGLSQECEPPLGCVFDARIRSWYCTDSQCNTDVGCPEGQVCQSIATEGDGPWVRFCVPVGSRMEGERCYELPGDKDAACSAGLLCVGQGGWCARPCLSDTTEACPKGFFCARTLPEPACLPSCEERGCPSGQQCILQEDGGRACVEVYGDNCQQTPCPQGRQCDVEQVPEHPNKVWMACRERCGEGLPPCFEGRVCDGWRCKPACAPQEVTACGAGYRCEKRRPDRPYACQPDW
ncbi:uncharacterized protein STAUR_1291 [Stigmatella aurantiaca DW4/3-1]|uniref:Uncharacterized protein n=1 Tax=Stigmatella aurantiaca (strain DW4/3-1) TaxID=378806 RepID=E3FHM3_STIAD|nr:uncharacterized protein STAUR_1291 [Stigmatella aurantiaca DW4/3-1]